MKFWNIYTQSFIIVVLIATFFGANITDSFLSDDYDWLHIAQEGAPLWKSFVGNYYGEHGVGGTFRPLVHLFFEVVSRFAGMNPIPYHALLLIVHAVNSILLMMLVRKLFSTHPLRDMIGFMAALIFALFPTHPEAVVWVAAVGDPLGLFFYLSAFLVYIHIRERSMVYQVPVLLLLLFSLLTKELALVFPFVLLAYEYWIQNTASLKKMIRLVLPSVIVVGCYLVYRYWAIGVGVGYYAEESLRVDFGRYLFNLLQFDVGGLFFGEARRVVARTVFFFWPVYLLLWIGLIGFLIKERKHKTIRILSFFIVFWLANIALVVPLGIATQHDEGVRYAYTATVAVAGIYAWGLMELYSRKKVLGAVCVGVWFLYSGYYLHTTLQSWKQASVITHRIIEQLTDFEYEKYKKSYLVGMPELYEGVPLVRNGLVQALIVYQKEGSVERVPTYSFVTEETLGAELYEEVQRLPDGVHLTTFAGAMRISGNATENTPEYKTELWNYDYSRGVADTLRVQFQGGREFDWARGEIQVVYWDGIRPRVFNK